MAKNFKLEGGQYEHPNEFKLIPTVRGTVILQPEFGNVIIQGDIIEAETHNIIQQNGVLTSKVTVTTEGADTVIVPTNVVAELDLADELKLMLFFETATTLPANTFIKIKETNVPVSNIGGYSISSNTPVFFVLFDNTFFPHKVVAGGGGSGATETAAGISQVATQIEVDSGIDDTKIVTPKKLKGYNKQATETSAGTAQIATQSEVDEGDDDRKIVTSKKLKEMLDSVLTIFATNYVNLTQLATESLAGIIKISTTAQVIAGTDDTTAVSPRKLKELYAAGSSKTQNGYQKLPNGVILQWGTIDYNSNPGEIAVDVVFPSVFPTSCLNVTATRKTLANNTGDGAVGIVSYSSGSVKFQLNTWSDSTSGLRGLTWFAIGY